MTLIYKKNQQYRRNLLLLYFHIQNLLQRLLSFMGRSYMLVVNPESTRSTIAIRRVTTRAGSTDCLQLIGNTIHVVRFHRNEHGRSRFA